MATTTITDNARRGWMQKDLDYTDVHKFALYNNSGHDASQGFYTATAESTGTGYVAKGNTLAGVAIAVDGTKHVAYLTWDNTEWTVSTITATDGMIFNEDATSPATDPSIYIGDFNGSKTTSAGTFTVQMPTAAFNTAIVRIA